MSIENQLQLWISMDNQIQLLNNKIKEFKEKRDSLEETIMAHMTQNNLTNKSIQLGDNKIKISNTKVHETLTFKYLDKVLNEIISNKQQVQLIIEHLKKRREIKIVNELKQC